MHLKHTTKTPQIQANATIEYTRVDPEIGRLCIALRRDAQLRLWAHLRDLAASRGGWLYAEDMYESLSQRSREYTKRHFRRLIAAGEGIFWAVWPGNMIALIGGRRLTAQLVRIAPPQLLTTNRPGKADVLMPLGENLAEWRAHLYGAWLAAKNDPTISRATLATLFGVSDRTLVNWERSNPLIRVATNYGQTIVDSDQRADRVMDYLPDDPSLRQEWTWDRRELLTWRLPNTYHATYKQTGAHYRARQRRRAANTALHPANLCSSGQNMRQYFDTARQLRSAKKRRSQDAPGMVWRGENRRGYGIWELTHGDPETGPQSRARGRLRRQLQADCQRRTRLIGQMANGHFFRPLICDSRITTRNLGERGEHHHQQEGGAGGEPQGKTPFEGKCPEPCTIDRRPNFAP